MSAFILSQILIAVAFVFDVASFQFKKREYLLICFTISAYIISIHFFLLEATTAGFVIGLSATRFLISIFTKNEYVKYFFTFVILCAGIITYDGVEDIFVVVAGLVATWGAFQSDDKILRQYMFFAILAIIIHNILIFSPAAIALEIFFLGSNVVGYWRHYIKNSQ